MNRVGRAVKVSYRFPVTVALTIVVLVLMFLILGSGCRDETLEDLPDDNQDIVQIDMTVYQAPDQFPNVVWFCNGSTGVYLTTREAGQNMQLLPNDGRCKEEGGG